MSEEKGGKSANERTGGLVRSMLFLHSITRG
jgi:hypothetical protein